MYLLIYDWARPTFHYWSFYLYFTWVWKHLISCNNKISKSQYLLSDSTGRWWLENLTLLATVVVSGMGMSPRPMPVWIQPWPYNYRCGAFVGWFGAERPSISQNIDEEAFSLRSSSYKGSQFDNKELYAKEDRTDTLKEKQSHTPRALWSAGWSQPWSLPSVWKFSLWESVTSLTLVVGWIFCLLQPAAFQITHQPIGWAPVGKQWACSCFVFYGCQLSYVENQF